MNSTPTVVNLTSGDTLVLVLPGNPTTGYTWWASDAPPCLKDLGQRATRQSTLIGAPSTIEWRWRAACNCRASLLRLTYGRTWDASTFQNYDFTVMIAKFRIIPRQVTLDLTTALPPPSAGDGRL